MNVKNKTISGYLAGIPADKRAALQRVRKIVYSLAPKIEESISYHVPVFKLNGKWIVYMAAFKNHCSLLGVDTKGLKGYDISGRGTIRFTTEKPLPTALIRRLIKARIRQRTSRKA